MTKYKKINSYENDNDNDDSLIDKKNIKSNICNLNIIFIYIFLFTILVLQAITLNYFIMIGNLLEKFNNVNINEINIYIDKTKTIIDYVCSNLIKC